MSNAHTQAGAVLPIALILVLGAAAQSAEPEPLEQDRTRPLEFEDDAPTKASAASTGRRSPGMHVLRPKFFTTQVNVDGAGQNIVGDAANEPSIAVDPLDPKRMVIGWRQFDSITSNFRQAGFAYTGDGGKTWTAPAPIEAGTFRSDPVVGAGTDGTFYYYSLSIPGGAFLNQMFASTDGGQTWGPAVEAFGGDKAWFTIDRTGGQGDGNFYGVWSIFAGCCGSNVFSRSVDVAQTWLSPIAVPSDPIWGTLDVALDGTLYVAGVDPSTFADFWVIESSTAQNPALTPSWSSATQVDLGGEIGFSSGPNPDGLAGQVWVATHPTDSDEVYLLCSVDPPGPDPLDVRFARSVDGGASWSASTRVNDDPLGADRYQWFGTMSVAPNGRIDVVWNDTRASLQEDVSVLFYAHSNDGGLSWSKNRALSPSWNSHVGWPNQNKIGDYYDMVSDDAGANLAWSATLNGEQDVYYARITP